MRRRPKFKLADRHDYALQTPSTVIEGLPNHTHFTILSWCSLVLSQLPFFISDKMRLTGSRVYSRPPPVPKMPPGLVELMEGLTKDVLKNNPPEVYEFCAEHMRKLLEIRDGSTNKITLSLEQKISRAQENVKKRTEQRWRKFDNELQLQDSKLDNDTQVKTNSVVDKNIAHGVIKPIHHNDLPQDSEIEISCDFNNTKPRHCKGDENQVIVTNVDGDNNNLENVNQAAVKEDTSNDLNNHLVSVCELSNMGQPRQDDCDGQYTAVDSIPKEFETMEKVKLTAENDEGHTKLLSDPIIDGCANDLNNDSENNLKEQETVSELEDTNAAIAESDVEYQPDGIKICSTIKLSDFEKKEGNNLTETTSNSENKNESISIVETMANDTENITDTNIADLNIKDIEITDNVNKNLLSEEKKLISEVNEDTLSEHDTKTHTDSTNNANESTIDLEKVMNDAIENTKRKDSSADDSMKDNTVFNDESDAEASEGFNLVLNKIASNGPVQENVANILVENEDANLSEETGNNNIDTSQHHDTADALLLSLHSPHDSNTEQSIIDQDDVNTKKMFKDSIVDDSVNGAGVDNNTPKSDNSNTMDLETAAVTIQKVFRTFLFKSRASTFDESVNEENNLSDDDDKKEDAFLPANNLNKERRTLGISRMDTVLQTVNEEKSLSLSTDDSSLSSAATIIQAHVRGFLLRNKLHSGKSTSKNSLGISNVLSSTSMDGDADQNKSKTVLNIHIVPEGGNYLSRDESMITSIDLSLDGSPPSSVNLHPLGYNKSERRKQLKREDAVQSVSPPSNNSGKLSEDVDSIKELPNNEQDSNVKQEPKIPEDSMFKDDTLQDTEVGSLETTPTTSLTVETVVGGQKTSNTETMSSPEPTTDTSDKTKRSLTKQSSDEMDVITPFKENSSSEDTKLLHSGEFHDTVLPTKVSRSDTPVVSEFKNVLVYFLLWNNS